MSPLGLNGPTSFQFSPLLSNQNHAHNVSGVESQPRYLSFVSCHTKSEAEHTATSLSGSPVRTMGSRSGAGLAERRLCVLDMKPFWSKMQAHAKDRRRDYSNQEDETVRIVLDPKDVMDNHAMPLLNTNPQYSKGITGSPQRYKSAIKTETKTLIQESESTLSLEERLRRERQRLSSSGVTQFAWGRYKVKTYPCDVECREKEQSRERHEEPPSPRGSRGPYPEDIPSLHNSPSKPHGGQTKLETKSQHSTVKSETMNDQRYNLRLIIPLQGNVYVQDGVGPNASPIRLLYDKNMLDDIPPVTTTTTIAGPSSPSRQTRSTGSVVGRDMSAIDPQLSPDGTMVAFVVSGEIHVMSCSTLITNEDEEDQDASADMQRVEEYEDVDGRHDMDSGRRTTDSTFVNAESGPRRPTQITFGAIIDEGNDQGLTSTYITESVKTEGIETLQKRFGRSITHGLADFVAQEEMDRYRGFWWDPQSKGILFARVDESNVPPYRIVHQGKDGVGEEPNYEDHRYPFAGEANPKVILGYVPVDRTSILGEQDDSDESSDPQDVGYSAASRRKRRKNLETENTAMDVAARSNWLKVNWFHPPPEASEYLARVHWLPNDCACLQWQDRRQSLLILTRINVRSGESTEFLREKSNIWINLHHMFKVLPHPIHPDECSSTKEAGTERTSTNSFPPGSFSFLFASERTGYCHLYLYTYIPPDGTSQEKTPATLLRAVSSGEWIIESIVGVDMKNNTVYVTGTFDSPLERHLYALPLLSITPSEYNNLSGTNTDLGGSSVRRGLKQVISSLSGVGSGKSGRQHYAYDFSTAIDASQPPNPLRLTEESGMHSVVMDQGCNFVVDTSSDLCRPTIVQVFSLPSFGPFVNKNSKLKNKMNLLFIPFNALFDLKAIESKSNNTPLYPPPEIISFPTSDGTEVLYAALYRPNSKVHGPGPYPLITSVYGGPHVQRVNRSWCQCADMRIQRLCALGFAVLKCDNRGSARRGLAFECALRHNLGRIEVLDQVTAVRFLVSKRIADSSRVGIYGWSYGGYLAAMCLCRAPDVFQVAVAGAPVTSWDGYDTHYTERYMGLPNENISGYHESALFEHTPNMRGKLMIIHGLIDENVHFRHTARLINRLIASGKDYDLLMFPDERHSPRKLRDRIYMEKRISDCFVKHLLGEVKVLAKERKMPGYL